MEGRKEMTEQSNFQGVPQHTSPFDAIRRVNEQGNEYWSARDLAKILTYDNYRNFLKVIAKAKIACEKSTQAIPDHFVEADEMVGIGSTAKRRISDVYLSRYACYLIVQNADSEKPIVALGQTYFAVQTRRQELADQIASLPEGQKRLVLRSQMAIDNQRLNEAARSAGVISPGDFAMFTDHGYRGLYNGLTENAIHTRKGLAPKEHILDYMGGEELGANIFRATQTEAKLKREQIQGRSSANQTHLEVGKEVRETIKRLGGAMPEDLPTPEKSIQQLQREEQKHLKHKDQLGLFDNSFDENE